MHRGKSLKPRGEQARVDSRIVEEFKRAVPECHDGGLGGDVTRPGVQALGGGVRADSVHGSVR